MDLATLLGLVGALAAICGSIIIGGSADAFINIPGLMIVIGGTAFVNLAKFPLSHTLGAFKVASKAFLHKAEPPTDLIAEGVELSNVARKEGLLGLESVEIKNPFLSKGVQLAIDGHEPEFVSQVLSKDINMTIQRHEQGQSIFRGIADTAPAMGMIGTLIGLVQMMSNMSDPKSIGPAMAVALLTTLYGAVIASTIAQPIAEKLGLRATEERINKQLILEIIVAIQEGLNPRVVEEVLKSYLPSAKRGTEQAEAA